MENVLAGVPYPSTLQDRLRNYLIGHAELELGLRPAMRHFAPHMPATEVEAIAEEALGVTWKASY